MKAVVTKAFDGLPDGELVVRSFKPDDEVSGELAAVAVREGWARKVANVTTAAPAPAADPAPAPAAKAGKGKAAKKPEPDADAGDSGEGGEGEDA